jgi:hypothetical protein
VFESEELENFLKTSHFVENNQYVYVEWNLNDSANISKIGNYRYRPGSDNPNYAVIRPIYDPNDVLNDYTGATDSNIAINAGFDDNDTPLLFTAKKEKQEILYSLADCFKKNRPRSGINKLLYLGVSGAAGGSNQYIDSITTRSESGELVPVNIANRPRYYMSSKFDDFKYWTSYRTDVVDGVNQEYGIASIQQNNLYYIYDAAPFVVYSDKVPANKIVIKMQTNVGKENIGDIRIGQNSSVPDPLYGYNNQTTPSRWKIEILDKDNNWVEAISFNEQSLRDNGEPIIGSDGTVEIEYGLNIPQGYEETFVLADTLATVSLLPDVAPIGTSYLIIENADDRGFLYVSDGATWLVFDPEYSWSLVQNETSSRTKIVKKLSDPSFFIENSEKIFREFDFVYGIRIVVDTMNKINSTFDLIEISPRIIADITNSAVSFTVKKTLSDLGNHSMPTGNLIASTGSIVLFDEDLSFNEGNTFDEETGKGSIISNYLDMRAKFLFYDVVKNVSGKDYYIPIKTLYSEEFPQITEYSSVLDIELRDLFYLLESKKAPEILLTDVSLSYAITILLDNIGFSNYIFKRIDGENELIIPYFFVGPDQNIAEVLEQLALSSQSSMFFDEYNNFVVMSKNYIMPDETQRETNKVLYGQEEMEGELLALPNIVNISSIDKSVYNDGEINYTTRYIQRSLGSINQSLYTDEYKTYIYKPVLLWEVAGQESQKTINQLGSQSGGGYVLSAAPIRATLTSQVPSIVNNEVVNNIIDFGENVYWISNYSGYFYSAGEIIRYDAVEYSVSGVGNVWITNNQEYQKYFSRMRFNGKMYPTGRVRIYAKFNNGEIEEHGRGQFGTEIVEHQYGIGENSTWINDNNVRGCIQNTSDYLFNTNLNISYPEDRIVGPAGKRRNIGSNQYVANDFAIKATRNGVIKNFMANTNITENETNYYKSALSGSIQSSALVFSGPSLPTDINPKDFVSYSYKELNKPYKHFGTRMRIIGKIESGTNKGQTPNGSFIPYPSGSISSENPDAAISITGGSGGIGINVNKETNNGYYFEIMALSQQNFSGYKNNSNNVTYDIVKSPVTQSINDEMIVTLKTQHTLQENNIVTISGLIDKNRSSQTNTRLNGQFLVTEISQDRKSFKCRTDRNSVVSAKITAASRNANIITYIAKNSFAPGQKVKISGINTASFNISSATIVSANSSSFTVANSGTNENASIPTNGAVAAQILSVVNAYSVDNGFTDYVVTENLLSAGQIITVTELSSAFNGTELIVESTGSTTDQKSISGVSSNGTYVTYTTSTNHGFFAGQTVKIEGIDPESYNWSSIKIYDTPSPTTFRVQSSVTDSVVSASGSATVQINTVRIKKTTTGTAVDGTGLMQYIPLNTIADSGGRVSVVADADPQISDVFFYKVVAGKNSSEIISKEKTNNLATLTTLRDHSFLVGEQVVVNIGDTNFDGTFTISDTTNNTISYTKTGSNIAETSLTSLGNVTAVDNIAIPEIIYRGLSGIIVDDGTFSTQRRLSTSTKNTVYDLAVEYINVGTTRRFYLYLNDKQIAIVDDDNPLPEYNNLALFVRGESRCMFENVYALSDNFAENSSRSLQLPVSKIFGDEQITETEAIRKYSLSGIIQNTYLRGISSESSPTYSIFYEEFGTIMREAAYFDIKYDRAYPSLYSKIADTLNRVKGYSVSGFFAGSYGAQFLIFNTTDKFLTLDDTTGNYLRILGIAFTQNTTYTLTVDDYFKKNSNLINRFYGQGTNPEEYQRLYVDIENSRNKHGRNAFNIQGVYLQSDSAAEDAMDWIIRRVMVPKKTVGVLSFATSNVQLGDIVSINYKNNQDKNVISSVDKRFVIYNIEYQKSNSSVETILHLAEI